MSGCRRPAFAAAAAAVVLLVACAYANRPSAWPVRGPFIRIDNPYDRTITVVAVDGMHRRWPIGRVFRMQSGCWRWPFVDTQGWLVVGQDSVAFRPWVAQGWRWKPGDDFATKTDGKC